MTKKISKAIIMVSSITLLCAIVLIVGSLYNYFTDIQKENQKSHLDLVYSGVSEFGTAYLNSIESSIYRITWIDEDGVVLFDSKADINTMENHGDREEFLEAIKYGSGESKRTSATLSEETLYSAKKLSDNSVIRVSFTQLTVLSLMYNIIIVIVAIAVISTLLSMFLASRISKKAVEPINILDLDNPLQNDVYDELTPLLHRIDKQNEKISMQIESLKEQKQELSFVTENVVDGIIIFNDKGNVLSCNKMAKRLFSCKEESYYLSFFRDLEYEKLIEEALRGKNGKIKLKIENEVYSFSASSTQSQDNSFSVFLFIHNITEEEKALEIRRQFSANVSHELKTPLTSIMGASELLSNGMVENENVTSFAKNIYVEAERLLKLVQDIIKISRLDEQSNFEFEEVDISNITKDVILQFQEKAKEKDITISVEYCSENVIVVPTILYEMLYNLFDNAIIYNKINGEISIKIDSNSDKVIWEITDSGVGIPNEHLPRIFERFYRVDKSHSKETGGTGLGLSIVKNGANLNNAELDIESTVGVGTKIRLVFDKSEGIK